MIFRPVLVNEMQTSPPSPPQKEPLSFYCPYCCAMFWNEWKINFPIFAIFIFWDIIVQKWEYIYPFSYRNENDAQFSETDFWVPDFFCAILSFWLDRFCIQKWLTVCLCFSNLIQTLPVQARVLNPKKKIKFLLSPECIRKGKI